MNLISLPSAFSMANGGVYALVPWLRAVWGGRPAPFALVPPQPPARLQGHAVLVQSPEELLHPPGRQGLLCSINELTRVTVAHFEQIYLTTLWRYAAFVQQLPASEAHHHAGLGGLLDHGLEAVVYALKLRRAHLLPAGATAETIDAQADLWTYAVFTAILLHDIGKPAVDQRIVLYREDGQALGPWDAWAGPMQAYAYEVRFVRQRDYRLHQRAAPLLAQHILPTAGLAWLTSEREVMTAWLNCLSGQPETAGPLGQIVEEADRLSTAANLSGHTQRQATQSTVIPLHQRLLTGLRSLLDRHTLALNRPGAAGWLIGDDLWLVVKTALDALRAHLLQEGQTGIPSDNRRLMDELQQRGALVPNGEKAVWSVRIRLGEWQQELTCLRFSAKQIWPNDETRPDACQGTSEPLHSEASTEAAMTAPLKQPPDQPSTATNTIDSEFTSCPADLSSSPAPSPQTFVTTRLPHGELDTEAGTADGATAAVRSATVDTPRAHDAASDAGETFLAWLQSGLRAGTIAINASNARVHRVKEGVLLVSPGIFQDYGKAMNLPWATVQKRFQKLKLHRKTPESFNVWNYLVIGQRKMRTIKGLLVTDVEKVFGSDLANRTINPHVSLSPGKGQD